VRAYFEARRDVRPEAYPDWLNLLVELKAERKVVGNVGIGVKNREQGQAEVGWLLGCRYRGQGIATEAVRAVVGFGFGPMGLHRIYARTGLLNERSWRLMERVGMRREAHFRQSHQVEGEWDDEFIYAILADEWREMQGERALKHRVLAREDIDLFEQIDRSERVDRIYYLRDGVLVLQEEHWDVPDWSPAEKGRRIAELQKDHDRGATLLGTFCGATLVGLAVLGPGPLPTGVDRYNLAGLWVSRPHRGRGVGRALVGLVERAARERGAKALYVSATPSEHTVGFYQSLGFRLTEVVDPELYEKEPEDIHMELVLR
jgi:RimJ/RimL family protein N-acetyltransferase